MSFWGHLGFRQNPYATDPVPSSEDGERLLVGRAPEIDDLVGTVASATAHALVDGANGVGKSSLIAVANHRLRQAMSADLGGAIFTPISRSINVTGQSTSESVAADATMALARGLVAASGSLRAAGRSLPELADLERWLSAPLVRSQGGGASVLGIGATATRTTSINTGSGFAAGLPAFVLDALSMCFPTPEHGAFVLVLENLERAGSAQAARTLLEDCRDPLFTSAGVRWIMCGAGDVLRGMSNAPRLDGVVGRPVSVSPITGESVAQVIDARVNCYRTRIDPLVPVDGPSFEYLFYVARGNLRTALRYSEEYSRWAYREDLVTGDSEATWHGVVGWLRRRAGEEVERIGTSLPEEAWDLFDQIVASEGTAEPLEVPSNTHRLLEASSLVSVIPDGVTANVTVEVSQTGWLVNVLRAA